MSIKLFQKRETQCQAPSSADSEVKNPQIDEVFAGLTEIDELFSGYPKKLEL
ncbi:hypothetical protein J2Y03_004567 [Neobacillus niacini]|uniref:hypothetical protein n=1 Tax=Neobacillus niacini TaxID=86668 RepID=UPI00285B33FB|nr:hypothetical protein [Neobacillus niacini]MDR7079509.1 hypothetical protein [Neobacillus niacini]